MLSALASCAPLAVGAAALQVFREGRREARLSLIVLFTAQIVMGAVAGGKGSFVIAVLAVVIPWTTAGRKPSNAAVTWLAVAAAAFLLIVIPFNQAYRATARGATGSLTPGQALSAAPGVLSQVLAPSALTAALPGIFALPGPAYPGNQQPSDHPAAHTKPDPLPKSREHDPAARRCGDAAVPVAG